MVVVGVNPGFVGKMGAFYEAEMLRENCYKTTRINIHFYLTVEGLSYDFPAYKKGMKSIYRELISLLAFIFLASSEYSSILDLRAEI